MVWAVSHMDTAGDKDKQEIDLLKQPAEKYRELKCDLMQKLLTGKWRIEPKIFHQHTKA